MYRPDRYTGIRDDELTSAEVAELFGVNVATVSAWARQGKVKVRRINTDTWAFDLQDVHRIRYRTTSVEVFDLEDTDEL